MANIADTAATLTDRRITLEQLRAFVMVAEGGSFAGASLDLGRTQSAVTQSLKKLEQILDCVLLERRQGHFAGLTLEGARFLPMAKEILARLSDAVGSFQRPPLAGRIRLGVPDDFDVLDIHGVLSRCLDMNPDLRIEVTSAMSAAVVDMFNAGEIDVALLNRARGESPNVGGAPRKVLRSEPLFWVGREKTPLGQLSTVPLVGFPDGCTYRKTMLLAMQRAGRPCYLAYTSSSYENIRKAVSAGLGIAVLPRGSVGRDHAILGAEEGFPPLPEAELVMVANARDELYRKFAAFLERSPSVADAVRRLSSAAA
ncbi:LysR substrate-binding domain-containing protein [Rhodomicrobium lacus]|uniref:LysR substrate-binding domain-containing protein n=1 Tax=Rhodomicrobium lacus TaxID=2498452 RepID=UPI0026E27B0F|nr:LysR substrate-binding domain-containing protein [Rhodomicrobium lacus]WKW49901.1 LysR family transcriptional regulator [Rhodomicrobium lacus]